MATETTNPPANDTNLSSPDNLRSDGADVDSVKTVQPLVELEAMPDATINMDKLAYAVAMAETNDCKAGMGKTKNNCFGIMTWPNGKRTGKYYNSKAESYADFKRIWTKSYGGFPTPAMARKWTGNDNATRWLNIVKHYYYLT